MRLATHETGPTPVAVIGEHRWPPADLQWKELALAVDRGRLDADASSAPPASVSFSNRRGVLTFRWSIPEDLDIIGPMALRLHIEIQGADDVHLFAGARKISAGTENYFEGSFGFSYDMVSKGWQRAAHRQLEPELSTRGQPVHRHERAEPFRSGEVVSVDIALRPHATRFRKGDELRIEVRGHWHYSRDPIRGQFPTGYQRRAKATCVLRSGGQHDSHLLLGSRPVPPLDTIPPTRPS